MQDLDIDKIINTASQEELRNTNGVSQLSESIASVLSSTGGYKLTPATLAVTASRGNWIGAKHLLYISAEIASALHRGNARLIVSMPPRHGKSELLSVWTPIWALDRDPHTEIILASYGAELASDFGRKTRDIILEDMKSGEDRFFNINLNPNTLRETRFHTTEGGGMRSVGIGGPITGRGADLFLIDDYLKNAKDASSEQLRKDHIDWLRSTVLTRLEPNASIIILATRWNIYDLIGELLSDPESDWKYIELPAMAEEGDVLGRKVGEALFPARYPINVLERIKKDLGEYFWKAMYQQRPISQSSLSIKTEKIEIIDPSAVPHYSKLITVRYWDLAGSEDGDFSVGMKMSLHRELGYYIIQHIFREQLLPFKLEAAIKSIAQDDGLGVAIEIEQEPGSAGVIVIDNYVRKVLNGYSVIGRKGTGDKFIRAQPYFTAVDNGLVKMVNGPWVKKYIEEMNMFPEGQNDDQVDASSGAFNKLNGHKFGGVAWGRKTTQQQIDEIIATGPKGGKLITGVTWGRKRYG